MEEEGAVQGESGAAEPHCRNTERSHRPGDSQEHTQQLQDGNKAQGWQQLQSPSWQQAAQAGRAIPAAGAVPGVSANRERDVPGTFITQARRGFRRKQSHERSLPHTQIPPFS